MACYLGGTDPTNPLSAGGSLKVGSKEWWLKQVDSCNRESLRPILQVVEDASPEQSSIPYLHVAKIGSQPLQSDWNIFDEAMLKQAFRGIGLFKRVQLEEGVKLGNYEKKIDMVSHAFDNTSVIIEFKIVEEDRGPGETKMPINIEKMGAVTLHNQCPPLPAVRRVCAHRRI